MLEPKPISCHSIHVSNDVTLFFTGPALEKGPMPALFYFALSGEDSLCLDPYNQIVQFLSESPIRIFSLTLPGHEANLPPKDALNLWAEGYKKGTNILAEFIDKATEAVNYVIDQGYTSKDKVAVAGLSRGGMIAALLAAADERIHFILQFAPLTDLSFAKEFHPIKDNPLVQQIRVLNYVEDLCNRHIRIYIGNRDTRVSTRYCFDFLEKLSDAAFAKNIRSPQVELFINPSIGLDGHGTPPYVFKQGADWLLECLVH